MKAWKLSVIILIILSSSGCAASKNIIKDNQNKVVETYLEGVSNGRTDAADYIKQNLKINQAYEYVKPYVPVVEPADVRLVWIPAHKSKADSNTLVSGHWVYIMVEQSRWFMDTQTKSQAKIPLIIPYKENSKK